jgi:hypothetical protein
VTLSILDGVQGGKQYFYHLVTDASAAVPAVLEKGVFAPKLGKIPQFGQSLPGEKPALLGFSPVLNGRTDKGSGEDQGFSTALGNDIDPIITKIVHLRTTTAPYGMRMSVCGLKRPSTLARSIASTRWTSRSPYCGFVAEESDKIRNLIHPTKTPSMLTRTTGKKLWPRNLACLLKYLDYAAVKFSFEDEGTWAITPIYPNWRRLRCDKPSTIPSCPKERGKTRGRIESRPTQPVNRAVATHQSRSPAIAN